jgi:hypothetical protein
VANPGIRVFFLFSFFFHFLSNLSTQDKTNMTEALSIAKQNDVIRNRYIKIKNDIVISQGFPLSQNKTELHYPLVCKIYLLGYTSVKKRGIVLSPEQLFRVCLRSLNVDLRNSRKIDQGKALELYRCVPGAAYGVTSIPTTGDEEYRIGEDVIVHHSVISTRIRAIILGYSAKEDFDRVVDPNDDDSSNHGSDNGRSIIYISSNSEEEDELAGSQSDEDDVEPFYVKKEAEEEDWFF